ncbi:hypothetical protein D3C81_1630940 [compost metagenome]
MAQRRFIKMNMHIDHAGQHILSFRIDDPGVRKNRQLLAQRGNLSVLHSDVQLTHFSGQHYVPIPDDKLIRFLHESVTSGHLIVFFCCIFNFPGTCCTLLEPRAAEHDNGRTDQLY